MIQLASSDSSAESEIAKEESMSRRNRFHDQMRWRDVGMLRAGARQSAVAIYLNVHRSVIHRLWNHYQRDQNASRRRGSGRRRIATTADDRYLLQCARRRKILAARQLLQESPYPAKLCRADCMKEDCSHDDLLLCAFVPSAHHSAVALGP
ncbi:hypothetical protein AVEN_59315-1 [Araneus ventricosus]|uniref:Paired domain-containing protein n=1 Tax=Araneus ventricosus TaxID=182803 RepID=A0A4Y2QB62_ARAVE|nr:hypothetical protein AVEN_59315-1 [Araneus ventricosus]